MQAIKKLVVVASLFFAPICLAATIIFSSTGYVNDFAGVLDAGTAGQITNILTQFEQRTTNEIAVLTIKSLEGDSLEDYAVRQFQAFGIGKKGKDNGALILVVTDDRQMRIEVGYGLEPYINDALAGRIIRDTMVPHFRNGDFSTGILNGVVETVSIIAKKSGVEFDPVAAGSISASTQLYHLRGQARSPLTVKIFKIVALIFIILIFIKNPWAALFILSSFGGGGRGGSFRGGFGGGFGGFGGGLSGGGGASGSW